MATNPNSSASRGSNADVAPTAPINTMPSLDRNMCFTDHSYAHPTEDHSGLKAIEDSMDELSEDPDFPALDMAAIFNNIPIPLPSFFEGGMPSNESISQGPPLHCRQFTSLTNATNQVAREPDPIHMRHPYQISKRIRYHCHPAVLSSVGGVRPNYAAIEQASEMEFVVSQQSLAHHGSPDFSMRQIEMSRNEDIQDPVACAASIPDLLQVTASPSAQIPQQQHHYHHIIHHHYHHYKDLVNWGSLI